jgi:hypothetical protein
MTESIRIEAQDRRAIFVDKYDDGVWINLMATGGSANCVLNKEQAQSLLEALQSVIQGEVEA